MRAILGPVLAGLLLAPGAAVPAPFTYFCSAPLAHSSAIMQVQPGPTYRLRGEIRPVQFERIPDPSQPVPIDAYTVRNAEVLIMNFETGRSLSLVVTPRYSPVGREEVADVHVQTAVDSVHGGALLPPLGSSRGTWHDLRFDIEVREDRVIVEAGGQRREFALAIGPGATIYLSCVGGSFTFKGVDLGG